MKKVLFIAPSCFPIYGSEASCNAKFLRLLSEQAIVDVITGKSYIYYPSDQGDEFYREKVRSIHVVRRNNKVNFSSIIEYLKIFIKTGYLYKGIAGTLEMISVSEKLMKDTGYDYIFTKDYPSEVVGCI